MSKKKLPKRTFLVIRLQTVNDRNGNPRRLSVVMNADEDPKGLCRWQGGSIVAALDEGYTGPSIVDGFVTKHISPWYDVTIIYGPTLNVPPSEYNTTKKAHGKPRQEGWLA